MPYIHLSVTRETLKTQTTRKAITFFVDFYIRDPSDTSSSVFRLLVIGICIAIFKIFANPEQMLNIATTAAVVD